MQVTHVIVHTPEQTREIVREALTIADELGTESQAWDGVFREACRLLGQHFTLAYEPSPLAPPLMTIPGNGRRA